MSETDARIRALIHTYIDHLRDAAYVRGIFALADVPTVAAVVLTMLRSRDPEACNDAAFFLRDVVNFGLMREFRDYLPQSGIYRALRDLLYAPNYSVRSSAIYTIGKIGPSRNARFLASAFPIYLA